MSEEYDSESVLSLNGDKIYNRQFLASTTLENLQDIIENKQIIFIDEGQKISRIGEIAKLLVDYYADKKQVIITGSSSIHLLTHTQEPHTGRKFVFNLFPVSLGEIAINASKLEALK